MDSGSISLFVRLRDCSTVICQVMLDDVEQAEHLTFVAHVVAQPLRSKSPWVESILEAINDQRLTTNYDMMKDEFLEHSNALLIYLVDSDAINIAKVARAFHELIEVKIWGNRLKYGAWPRRWHLAQDSSKCSGARMTYEL